MEKTMINNILDLVKKLSINDKKTISQKTLKTVEEVAEDIYQILGKYINE